MQNTLKSTAVFTGLGLHSGAPVRMVVHPAPADHGIWFRRTDVTAGDALIPARWDAVVPSKLCTLVANAAGAQRFDHRTCDGGPGRLRHPQCADRDRRPGSADP